MSGCENRGGEEFFLRAVLALQGVGAAFYLPKGGFVLEQGITGEDAQSPARRCLKEMESVDITSISY
jgi:hypothetical protein